MPYSNRYPAWDGKCYLCRGAYYGQDHKCPKCGTTEPNYALTSIRTDEPQSEIIKGYHQKIIQKGVLGEPSKIREEFEEFMDSVAQDNPVMALIELSDLIGAIEAYAEKNNVTLDNLITMKNATKRAFETGHRK